MKKLRKTSRILFLLLSLSGLLLVMSACSTASARWSDEEKEKLRNLWIGSLKPLPPNPSNRYADDPRAAKLGQKLFFDTRFSANGKVSCATCHVPGKQFQDGLQLGHGVGTTNRRTMTVLGAAYSPWQFWDGHKDSLWAQATGPMESSVEHGGNRLQYAHLIEQYYKNEYEQVFGALPDLSGLPANAGPVEDAQAKAAWETMTAADRDNVSRIYANMGKAIEAYERKLIPGASRFDRYVDAVLNNQPVGDLLTPDEAAGLRLFTGKADCIKCHNGPLFTNNDFHNTGVPPAAALPEDHGRAAGAKQVLADEFNCLSPYSDAGPDDCADLRYMIQDDPELERQFKPPSLRNVAERGPYMHAGQFKTLEEVLDHYNRAPAAQSGHSELEPLKLKDREIQQIIAFLKTLDSPVNADPVWLKPPQ